MKLTITVAILSCITILTSGCGSAGKEVAKTASERNLDSTLNSPVPGIPVDVTNHFRFENLTSSTIAVKLGSTAEKIGPGSHVYIPEQYDDSGWVDVKIAQKVEKEVNVVYRSRWSVSEKFIESCVITESADGKIQRNVIREPVEEIKNRSVSGGRTPPRSEPRRRVILEKK